MRHGSRSHLIALVAAFAAASASFASACSSDSTVGTPGDATGDASAAGDAYRPDVQAAADAPPSGDVSAPETDGDDGAPPEDVVNPYTDAFETYDAATDVSITPERDTGSESDVGGPHMVDAASD